MQDRTPPRTPPVTERKPAPEARVLELFTDGWEVHRVHENCAGDALTDLLVSLAEKAEN